MTQIQDETLPGAHLKHSQAADNGKARLQRHATRLPFIQESYIGPEVLGQENGAAFAGAETLAGLLQGRVRW